MTLEQAAAELLEYAKDHIYNPLLLQPVPDEFTRDIILKGQVYRLILTRLHLPNGKVADMLSMSKMVIGELQVPPDSEQEEIVRGFFPTGMATRIDNTPLQLLRKPLCAKYIQIKE